MLSILLHTQTDDVRERECVDICRSDRCFILVIYILKNLQFTLHCFEYTSSTITPRFVLCMISLPCYPAQLQLIDLYIIV